MKTNQETQAKSNKVAMSKKLTNHEKKLLHGFVINAIETIEENKETYKSIPEMHKIFENGLTDLKEIKRKLE